LDCSLDREAGGSLARNLAGLYQYMRTRLLAANIRQEDAPLAEVESLLRTLGEAWSAIRPVAQAESKHTAEAHRGLNAFAAAQPELVGQGWSA
jgi:flagellar protein FliS